MIKRTIDISSDAVARLRIEDDQLVIEREGTADGGVGTTARVPCEDVGILLIDQQRVMYTHSVMTRLMGKGACVMLCDERHMPCGMMVPLEGNELVTQRLRKQIEASRPLEKRLWQQIVRAKIAAQRQVLGEVGRRREAADPGIAIPGLVDEVGGAPALRAERRLGEMVREVQSGDATNVEGQAARAYWAGLLGEGFRRARGGAWPNPVLNYGYMVMRGAVARAIAGAGLHPSFGLHHHNRGNAFCLADDLMEPLRPLVDAAVVGLLEADKTELVPGVKRVLLELLTWEVEVGERRGPLMVQLHRMAASVWGCFEGTERELALPRYEAGALMEAWRYADV
jgi:CRISP-associated protein Cas1